MSRHRDIRNLNLADELDDEALSDGGEEEMTPEQQGLHENTILQSVRAELVQAQMNDGLDQVRLVVGDEAQSGLSDNAVRDALWEYYFDVERTIQWAFEERDKIQLAKERKAAKEREKTLKLAQRSAGSSRAATPVGSASKVAKKAPSIGISTPPRKAPVDQQKLDLSGLNLDDNADKSEVTVEEPPKMSLSREKVLEEARRVLDDQEKSAKQRVSIVVIGHVDAGKSTLMGRLLYELGRLDEKTRRANERGSEKIGKSSFSWAWGLDESAEERERGITMDIALQSLETPHRQITVLDAPGHKDFIPNMISGASQADSALLVVDAGVGEFEAGFQRNGQTREHLLLVRSLGVSQVIIAVNKLDQVEWSRSRYEEICGELRPFLTQSGFQPSKTKFVPVAAMEGVNLVGREGPAAAQLSEWYNGPTLVDLLDDLVPPVRDINAPTRIPISNVFRRQSSGVSVTGRVCGGVIQVGEKLRVLPGDETGISFAAIEIDDQPAPWAASGSNISLHLVSIDPVNVNIGSVLCLPTELVPLATVFTARIVVFDIEVPITAGASVELFHHSRDVPATTTKLISIIDRASGKVLKTNPRVLTKGSSAEVQITLRSTQLGGQSTSARGIPLETFSTNKDMGRILLRRGGETIAAGIVLAING
ncbi:hypothetical protein CVT26_000832 [Gymnopilus dilepis]|uniref:Elongation factor 1 alpha-like protein n=1 Tax=Gymnopilus dilepis TaxID=231916 RepID=A0A409YMM4_9AGAR|nr:hypothetical protein CVT26_000832 [Gymnopilus dilepis]